MALKENNKEDISSEMAGIITNEILTGPYVVVYNDGEYTKTWRVVSPLFQDMEMASMVKRESVEYQELVGGRWVKNNKFNEYSYTLKVMGEDVFAKTFLLVKENKGKEDCWLPKNVKELFWTMKKRAVTKGRAAALAKLNAVIRQYEKNKVK